MSPSQIFRIGAAVLLLGGILGVVSNLTSPTATDLREQVASPLFAPSQLLGMAAWLLIVVALPAAYARMARSTDTPGLLGFVMLIAAGVMVGFVPPAVNLLLTPWLVSQPIPAAELASGPATFSVYFPIGLLLVSFGAILFGLAIVRSRVYSRWPGYLIVAAGVLNLVAIIGDLPEVVWTAAWVLLSGGLAWLGYDLWRVSRQAEAERIERGRDLAA